VSPFKPEILSLLALRKMLEEDVNRQIKLKRKGYAQNPQSLVIYTKVTESGNIGMLKLNGFFFQNKPADYFVLILEGLAEVSIGQENLVFVARPFTTFGVEFFMSVCEWDY
jgi:metal transporter CNNM